MLQAPGGNNVGTWTMEKFGGYLADSGREAQAEALLKAMVAGVQVDPQWQARQSQTTGQVSQIVTQTNKEIQGIIKSTFEYQQKTQDADLERYNFLTSAGPSAAR